MKLTDFAVDDRVVVRKTNGLRNVSMPKDRSGVVIGIFQSEFPIEVRMSDNEGYSFKPHELQKDVIPSVNNLRVALVELAAEGVLDNAFILVPVDDVCVACSHFNDSAEIMKDHCKWCEANAAIALFDAIAEPED